MRVLVVSNCATSAYAKGLKALFPDWEVRGAIITLAEEWATAEHAAFVDYARDCDLYLGLPPEGSRYGRFLSPEARHLLIPGFGFRGLQPDAIHLDGLDSVLGKGGTLFSRIVVAAFQGGLDTARTIGLFNPTTYDALGYFTCFDDEKRALLARFNKYGIDLTGCVERWTGSGNFLYSYNHPRIDVLTTVLRRALAAAGYRHGTEDECDRDLGIIDDLETSIRWPVYPEIARLHGMPEEPPIWRMGRLDHYRAFDLYDFVRASFSALAGKRLPEIPQMPRWVDLARSLAG